MNASVDTLKHMKFTIGKTLDPHGPFGGKAPWKTISDKMREWTDKLPDTPEGGPHV